MRKTRRRPSTYDMDDPETWRLRGELDDMVYAERKCLIGGAFGILLTVSMVAIIVVLQPHLGRVGLWVNIAQVVMLPIVSISVLRIAFKSWRTIRTMRKQLEARLNGG
ncbi:MAG: hypothetical protein QM831_25075 [Kofleriaceae bacterium]